MMERYNSIIFDLGGVIFDIDFNNTLRELEEKKGVRIEPTTGLYELCELYEKGRLSNSLFRERMCDYLGVDLLASEFDRIWCATLVGADLAKIEYLRELKDRYKLYLLSNTNEIHWRYITMFFEQTFDIDFSDIFDKVYLSYQLELSKPDIRIFQSIIDDAHLDVSKSLFIDDRKENLKSALQMGFDVIQSPFNGDWMTELEKKL